MSPRQQGPTQPPQSWAPPQRQAPQPIKFKGHNGTVILDRDFVTIKRIGFMARATVGKGEKRIPLASITAVQWKPSGLIMEGFIQFTVPGGNERRSRVGSQSFDARHDENSVTFMNGQMAAFGRLRAAVESAIIARQQQHQQAFAPAPVAAPDYMAQLRQLGDLRDAGILSDAEFDAKKADILARM